MQKPNLGPPFEQGGTSECGIGNLGREGAPHLSQRRRWGWIFLLLTACTPRQETPPVKEIDRPPVEVEASVDRAVATTGDLLTYTITVNHDPAYEIDAPEAGQEIAGFRIIDTRREEPRTVGGRIVLERWYELRADLVGSYILPPVTVSYRLKDGIDEEGAGQAETSEIFVEVESVLPAEGEEEATDIRGLKPLRSIEEPRPWWHWVAGGGALASLLGLLGWWLLRRRRARPAPPPLPAHEVAFRALNDLRGTDFEDPEAVRRFHFRLSEVVRAYVEGRFGLNATDLTTEEILRLIPKLTFPDGSRLPVVPVDEGERLGRFLEATDRVKFAAHEPSEEEVKGVYEDALSFVEATRPSEPEEEAEATEQPQESTREAA